MAPLLSKVEGSEGQQMMFKDDDVKLPWMLLMLLMCFLILPPGLWIEFSIHNVQIDKSFTQSDRMQDWLS